MNSFAFKNAKPCSNELRGFVILHAGKRAKTERCQLAPQQHYQVTMQKSSKLIPLIDKPSDFPTIFSRHKRIQYSGYKQCNLNKSKFISFEEQHRRHNHQPMRQYEANLKNISKLRKRYSLEPQYLKNTHKREKDISQTSFFKISDQSQIDVTNSESKHHQNLREIMRKFLDRSNISKRSMLRGKKMKSCFRIEEDTNSSTNVRSQKQQFHRYEDENQEVHHARSELDNKSANQYKPLKFAYLKLKPQPIQRLQIKQSTHSTKPINTQQAPQIEQELCGWQNRTFCY